MSEPNEWALRKASSMVSRWEHGNDEHRQWLRDMCIPEVALALDAARRKGIEEVDARYERFLQMGESFVKGSQFYTDDQRQAIYHVLKTIREGANNLHALADKESSP